MISTDPCKYTYIEALRFIAAMLIVFVHIDQIGIGHIGVDIFFIISGLVIAMATEQSTKLFLLKRFSRIVPLYWLSTFSVFLIVVIVPELLINTTENYEHLLKSLFFVPFDKNGMGHYPVYFLGWTLNYEIYFYTIFFLSLKLSHKFRCEVASCILVLNFFLFSGIEIYPLEAYSHTLVVEFIIGMAIWMWVYKREYIRGCLLICLIFSPLILPEIGFFSRAFKYGIPAFFLIIFFLSISSFFETSSKQFWIFGGAVSYSLYLSHPFIIRAIDFMNNAADFSNVIVTVILKIGLSLIVAYLVFRFFDSPLSKIFKSFLVKAYERYYRSIN